MSLIVEEHMSRFLLRKHENTDEIIVSAVHAAHLRQRNPNILSPAAFDAQGTIFTNT
jgi:hypothetical protein